MGKIGFVKKGDFDGVGYPVTDSGNLVILSRGNYLYGRVDYVTERQGMMVVWTLYRRQRGTITRRFKQVSYLKDWEEVRPARYMLAVEGKIVSISPPE